MELARRQAALIAQEDENARRVAEGKAAAAAITVEADVHRVRAIEAARNAGESERVALLRGVDPAVLQAMTLRSFADKLTRIDTLNVTPDLTASLAGLLRPPAPPPGAGVRPPAS